MIILFSLGSQPLTLYLIFLTLLAGFLTVSIALLGGAQTAIFSLSSKDLEELQLRSSKRYQYLLRMMEKPRYLLATIDVLQTFFTVLLVLLIGYVLVEVAIINFSDMHLWLLIRNYFAHHFNDCVATHHSKNFR